VAVVAPSGPVPEARLEIGLALLRQRYEVACAPGLLSHTGHLAGSDGRRLAELRWGLSDPSVRAVFCARGGYGLLRNLPALQAFRTEERRTLPIVGFSDVTVLLAWATLGGMTAIHGPVVTQMGDLPPEDIAALFALLESSRPPGTMTPLQVLSPGTARGRLLGGNLEMLSRLCGTSLQRALLPGEPVILLLEEVGERPYRIDRALTQLLLSGALSQVAGVVIGDLVRCGEADGSGPTALEVITERLGGLGVPMAAGAPIGHGSRNRAVPLGALVELSSHSQTLTFL
jgi:muramoyltetrapeptide carboxypeptidase